MKLRLTVNPEQSTAHTEASSDDPHDEPFAAGLDPEGGADGSLLVVLDPLPKKERMWVAQTLEALMPYLAASKPPPKSLSRLRYYYFRAKESFKKTGNYLNGLKRKVENQGNKDPKADTRSVKLAKEFIKEQYFVTIRPEKKDIYGKYKDAAELQLIEPISYDWFCQLTQSTPPVAATSSREGRGRAYSKSRGTGPSLLDTDRTSGRIWGRGHVDSTQLEVLVRCRYTYIVLGRPWLYILSDAYSWRVLAFLISFCPPSRFQVLALLRECIRRWQRVPAEIVYDKGPEYRSTDYELLLPQLHMTGIRRRTRHGRDGRVVEDLFNQVNKHVCHSMEGNTQNTKNPRALTDDADPSLRAIHFIDTLYETVEDYFENAYDDMIRGILGVRPKELFGHSQVVHGARDHVRIAYDRALVIATSPTARPEFSTIDPRQGIRCGPLPYWHPLFADPTLYHVSVPRKIDLLSCNRIFVRVNKEWIDGRAPVHPDIDDMSPQEMRYLSEEYFARHQRALILDPHNLGVLSDFRLRLQAREAPLRELLAAKNDAALLRRIIADAPNAMSREAVCEPQPQKSTVAPKPTRNYGVY